MAYHAENGFVKTVDPSNPDDDWYVPFKESGKLYELNINILDITQTILSGYFTMMMVVDIDGAEMDFGSIDQALQPVRDELKMAIHIQRMDIFDAMHRI